jgi:hypothetical protein
MNKKGCLVIITIIFLPVFFAGCVEDTSTDVENNFDNIEFESEVTELIYGRLNYVKDNNIVIRTELEYLLKNIAGKVLNLKIVAEFYDSDNNLLYTAPQHTIDNMPVNYQETDILASNILSYDGEFTDIVDHVKLVVTER